MVQAIITRGKAVVKDGGLRCNTPRPADARRPSKAGDTCNKLLAKTNSNGQIAGSFLCDRCKGEVEVQLPKA